MAPSVACWRCWRSSPAFSTCASAAPLRRSILPWSQHLQCNALASTVRFALSKEAEHSHRPLTVHVDTQDEAEAPAEIKVVREPPALPPPALMQTAEAPAAAQPSDVQVVLEEADDAFDADALSPLPVAVRPAEEELRRLEAEFEARDNDGRQENKDTQQRVLGLLSDALGKTKEYKDGRFMLIRGSEPEKGATGMVLVRAHPPCDARVSG